ncbi:MAG: hypothetical protein Q8930_20380, partial [Bacillota bacterium]|nr:hypothetical protein [Bacillota bacterium]
VVADLIDNEKLKIGNDIVYNQEKYQCNKQYRRFIGDKQRNSIKFNKISLITLKFVCNFPVM